MGLAGVGAAGVGVLTAADDYAQQKQQAAMTRYQNSVVRQNVVEQYRQLSQAEVDIIAKGTEESLNNQLSMVQLIEKAKLLAGSSGTAGNSVNAMLVDLRQQGGKNQSAIIHNTERELDGITRQADQILATGQSQLRFVMKPNAFRSLFKGAAAGASAYSSFSGLSGAASGASSGNLSVTPELASAGSNYSWVGPV